jgi:hypothetical protein
VGQAIHRYKIKHTLKIKKCEAKTSHFLFPAAT